MSEDAKIRQRFTSASDFVVYYGAGRASELASHQLAIVEAAGQSSQSVRQIASTGTLLLAYLSVLELPAWDSRLGLLLASDRLYAGGLPQTNPEHGGILLDLRSPRCQRLVLHEAGRLLKQGYHGLFLDTIGEVEAPGRSGLLRAQLISSAAAIVRRLRTLYPAQLLVQNNGLAQLIGETAPELDGVCWENPPDPLLAPQELRQLQARINRLAGGRTCRLLLLLPRDRPRERAPLPAGIAVYRAPKDYLTLD